jgi:hypothetical protein
VIVAYIHDHASCLTYKYSYFHTEDETMRVWLACFFVLFALAEFFDWVKALSLPLPIYILGGAFLAVASNYDKIVGSQLGSVKGEISPELPKLEASTQSTPIDLSMLTPVVEVQKSQPE